MRTVIKGGTVITASDTYVADVLIEDEQIAANDMYLRFSCRRAVASDRSSSVAAVP